MRGRLNAPEFECAGGRMRGSSNALSARAVIKTVRADRQCRRPPMSNRKPAPDSFARVRM